MDFWVRNSIDNSFSDVVKAELSRLIQRLKNDDVEKNQLSAYVFSTVKHQKYIDRIYKVRSTNNSKFKINNDHIEREIEAFRVITRLLERFNSIVRVCYFDDAGSDAQALKKNWSSRDDYECKSGRDSPAGGFILRSNSVSIYRHSLNLVAIMFALQDIFIEEARWCLYLYPISDKILDGTAPFRVELDKLPIIFGGYGILSSISVRKEYYVEQERIFPKGLDRIDEEEPSVTLYRSANVYGPIFLCKSEPILKIWYIPYFLRGSRSSSNSSSSSSLYSDETGFDEGSENEEAALADLAANLAVVDDNNENNEY